VISAGTAGGIRIATGPGLHQLERSAVILETMTLLMSIDYSLEEEWALIG